MAKARGGSGRKKRPEVYALWTHPIRKIGADYQRYGVTHLKSAGDGSGFGTRQMPFLLQQRDGRGVTHENQPVKNPGGAESGQPEVKTVSWPSFRQPINCQYPF